MENRQRLKVYLPLRMSPNLSAALAQKAKTEAGKGRPNLSATVRRAIRFYLIEGGRNGSTLET